MNSDRIEQLLRQHFPQAEIVVSSEDNVHFNAKVIDAGFDGLSRIARHRLIHDAIGPAMGREIHALSLNLLTPEQAV
ncbi:MAG: BolA/IbaG family iron-sulfur metabolism protein [Pseudomonadota bacterium]